VSQINCTQQPEINRNQIDVNTFLTFHNTPATTHSLTKSLWTIHWFSKI